jgi:hypothetical protein
MAYAAHITAQKHANVMVIGGKGRGAETVPKCASAISGKKKRRKNLRSYVFYLVHLQGLEPWAH